MNADYSALRFGHSVFFPPSHFWDLDAATKRITVLLFSSDGLLESSSFPQQVISAAGVICVAQETA
jgi:hypothetical protein